VYFAFTDDQLEFRDAVRTLLVRECTPASVRAAWESSTGVLGGAWHRLAAMGVLGLRAPAAAGGLGLSDLDLVLLLEETGYFAVPGPVVEHAAVGVPVMPDPAPAAAGDVTVTAALGEDPWAQGADVADLFVLAAADELHLVARSDVELVPLTSVDSARRVSEVHWTPSAATRIGGVDALGSAFDRGVLGAAAQLVGLARRMIDMTVEYSGQRYQFGAPIGSFQAVKHHLADARIALEFARPLVYRGAWALSHDDPLASMHASMAKATASDAAMLASRKALQCHGAMGYSYEYDLHLFAKRAWALAADWGDATWHRSRVGGVIL
jgi:alkylation response protein AidB-like acyl-CoA dehydrogenase